MFRKLYRNETGQTIVLVALMMVMLIGFGALTIDVGAMTFQKSNLQNAADSAALAGVQNMTSVSDVKKAVIDYARSNGLKVTEDGAPQSGDTITINTPYNGDSKKVEVIITREVKHHLAGVLGLTQSNISARAVAEKSGFLGAAFNYAVFHGSEDDPLRFNSSSIDVDGDFHSNHAIQFNSLYANIKGTLEAASLLLINSATIDIRDVCLVSSITKNSSTLNVNGSTILNPAPIVEMPDFSDILKEEAQTGITYTGNKTFNSGNFSFNQPIYVTGDLTLNSGNFYFDCPIYVEGKLTINSTNFIGKGIIYAKNDIKVNSASFATTAGTVSLYSGKNIELNSMWADINGFMYAPNGTIIMNSMSSQVNGSVIGNEIKLNSGYLKVNYGGGNYDGLPDGGSVKLIE
ncbi:MAG TPA: pilus assembly protein TadG-related protein [Sedimentibacter sp.]|nr:pilus assembly protein TadG-related protein [Sedimentibacter sp.]